MYHADVPTLQTTNYVFQALADPTRLRLLSLIGRGGEVCVCDLVRVLGMSQPKISRHLAILREADLVVGRKDGRWVHYSLAKSASQLHRRLLGCLTDCCGEVEILADDAKRLKAAGPLAGQAPGCCVDE